MELNRRIEKLEKDFNEHVLEDTEVHGDVKRLKQDFKEMNTDLKSQTAMITKIDKQVSTMAVKLGAIIGIVIIVAEIILKKLM